MNKAIHILLGALVLLAITLIYFLLLRDGQTPLAPSQWLVLAGAALALVLGAFLPSVVRRVRGLPQEPMLPSDAKQALRQALKPNIILTLCFLAVLVWFSTANIYKTNDAHNAQLTALTEVFNAQILAQTEVHNAQLTAQAEASNAQLKAQAERDNAQLQALLQDFKTKLVEQTTRHKAELEAQAAEFQKKRN